MTPKYLYIFTQWGNYGQFVVAVVATDAKHAHEMPIQVFDDVKNGEIHSLADRGWHPTPDSAVQVHDSVPFGAVFSGGGDNG